MFRALIHWLLSAIALMITANFVPGFYVNDVHSALVAALAIGILNATLGFLMKVITFPFAILTFGLFLIVINASMILLASCWSGTQGASYRLMGEAASLCLIVGFLGLNTLMG